MAAEVLDRINRFSASRSELYRQAAEGMLGPSDLRRRIAEIDRQVESLWERRRRERAGRLEGIDLLVSRAYETIYGKDLDAVPIPVREEQEMPPHRAA